MSLAMQRTSVRKPNIERTFDKLASFAKTTGLWKKRGRVFCKDGRDVVADADINIEKKSPRLFAGIFPGMTSSPRNRTIRKPVANTCGSLTLLTALSTLQKSIQFTRYPWD